MIRNKIVKTIALGLPPGACETQQDDTGRISLQAKDEFSKIFVLGQ